MQMTGSLSVEHSEVIQRYGKEKASQALQLVVVHLGIHFVWKHTQLRVKIHKTPWAKSLMSQPGGQKGKGLVAEGGGIEEMLTSTREHHRRGMESSQGKITRMIGWQLAMSFHCWHDECVNQGAMVAEMKAIMPGTSFVSVNLLRVSICQNREQGRG